jgi:hypothetical protein
MKKSSDTIGNRTLDLPVCSVVPQATAAPRASKLNSSSFIFNKRLNKNK